MYDFKYIRVKIIVIGKSLKLNFLTIFSIITVYFICIFYNKISTNFFNKNIFAKTNYGPIK